MLGVPDLYLDENAVPGGADANTTNEGGPDIDGSSSGAPGDGAPPTCNADLKTDKANCGACGHDCTNGVCTDGVCTLADNLPSPTDLTVRGNTIYYGLQGVDGIASCPITGCASASVAPKKLTPDDAGSFQPNRVVANDTHVYAADYYTGTANRGRLLKVAVGGGLLERVPPAPLLERSYDVAIDGTALYWTEIQGQTSGIYACLLPNCPTAITVHAGGAPELIAVGADGAIVWSDGDLYRCPSRANCPGDRLVQNDPPGVANDLMIDGATVFWGTNLGAIYSCSTAGCANATKILEESPKATIGAIAANGTFLAWSIMPFNPDGNTVDDKAGVIKSCNMPKCSGADVKVLATGQKDPAAMALDAKSVYWANSGKRGFVDGIGQLMKAPR